MQEEYIRKLVTDISKICHRLEVREEINGMEVVDLRDIRFPEKNELDEYLTTLSGEDLTTICALMSFGREYGGKVLNINLKTIFEKYHIEYWNKELKGKNTPETVDYLSSKAPLATYLNRAVELLFENAKTAYNIDKHICGGCLIVDNIEYFDYDEYEVVLKCLKCNELEKKILTEDWIKEYSI